jgi:hypothetical protein
MQHKSTFGVNHKLWYNQRYKGKGKGQWAMKGVCGQNVETVDHTPLMPSQCALRRLQSPQVGLGEEGRGGVVISNCASFLPTPPFLYHTPSLPRGTPQDSPRRNFSASKNGHAMESTSLAAPPPTHSTYLPTIPQGSASAPLISSSTWR